jgi:hypothetical protein
VPFSTAVSYLLKREDYTARAIVRRHLLLDLFWKRALVRGVGELDVFVERATFRA